ncbi:transglutaminase domain-containing protein [Salinibacterium sp. NK8237]|uniref:transglutaminase family protein n=1 Tax=Salinibacterium sp. NK8237 TaxID=2792038 RepID=UPI0018CE9FA5|nr:transglutaminase domain-containing protein [Salinibacterium sp. NK8237]MBH0129515.1 transglutaminase domain-containing protein [Salinibacterium sp. NK8237]
MRRTLSARTWADVSIVLALTIIGLLGFEPSFGGYSFLLPAIGGLVLGAATGIVASILRVNVVTTIVVAVVAYFLCGTAIAVPQQAPLFVLPTLQSLSTIAIGTVYGWADIVTLQTPIEAPQHITVVPYFATWLVALVSTSLAVRWLARARRSAWRFGIVLLGPLAIYVASILIGTDDPYQAGIRGVSFAVLALLWLGWHRTGGDNIAQAGATRMRTRKIAGTAVVLAAAVLLGGGAGWWIAPAQDQRFVLRDEIEPPFDPLQYPSPLAGFRHYTKQVTDDVLFTVSGLKAGDTVRLATLDSFTGKLWNVTGSESSADGSGTFSLVGRELPAQSFVTPERRTDVTFTMGEYADVWMPSIGYPTNLDFTAGSALDSTDSLRYNATTGTAVLTAGLSEGDSYTIDATLQQVVSIEDLADVPVAAVELPPVSSSPDIVTSKAQEYAADATAPAAQLEAIRLALTTTGFLSHGRASDTVASRAGHGADRITDLLERNQMVGDQEQYASAFALMARSFGYPARVVMGFAPEIVDGQTAEVTGGDVTAWVEVAFDDVGWVVFDPTPDETDIPQDQTPKPQSEPQPQVRQPPRVEADAEDLLTPVELEESDEDDEGVAFSIPGWVYAVGLSLLIPAMIIFMPLLIIGLYKLRRARRRRDAKAAHDQVAGAWEELVDQYSELGYDVPQKATRVMVAESLENQIGGEHRAFVEHANSPTEGAADTTAEPSQVTTLRPIAVLTDDAVFSGQEISAERSDEAWSTTTAAIEAGRAGLTKRRRIVSRYRIRSARDWASRISTKREDS